MDWQPIDTAPKDGTTVRLKRIYNSAVIAVGRGFFGTITVHYPVEDGGPTVFRDVWGTDDGAHFFPTPTHWLHHRDRDPDGWLEQDAIQSATRRQWED